MLGWGRPPVQSVLPVRLLFESPGKGLVDRSLTSVVERQGRASYPIYNIRQPLLVHWQAIKVCAQVVVDILVRANPVDEEVMLIDVDLYA